jgi:hypothetical protein
LAVDKLNRVLLGLVVAREQASRPSANDRVPAPATARVTEARGRVPDREGGGVVITRETVPLRAERRFACQGRSKSGPPTPVQEWTTMVEDLILLRGR